MHKAIIGASVSVLLACEPSLGDGQGARCGEKEVCEEGLSCYRGFCLPDLESPPDAAAVALAADAAAPPRDQAGAPSREEDAAAPSDEDAGARSAAGNQIDADEAPLPDAAAPPAASPPGRDAAVAAPGNTAPPAMPGLPAADASAPVVPDAFVLPVDCMLKECCREAQAAAEQRDSKEDDGHGKPGKLCGCDDPQLFERLFCSAL